MHCFSSPTSVTTWTWPLGWAPCLLQLNLNHPLVDVDQCISDHQIIPKRQGPKFRTSLILLKSPLSHLFFLLESPMHLTLRFYTESARSRTVESVVGRDPGTMNPHTTADVFIVLVIFLALIISLCVLAWKNPTSHRAAIPMHNAALPTPNIAPPVHSVVNHRRSFAYLFHLSGTSSVIRWWARASPNRTNRIPSIIVLHREDTIARALPAGGAVRSCTRTLTLNSTIAPISSGGTSTIDTLNGETIELRELDGTKGLSTSSLAETNDAEPGEPVVLEAIKPFVCPMLEVDIADVDTVAIADQSRK